MSEKKESGTDIEKFDKVEVLDEEYIVEKIIDKKKVGSIWKYKVKWEGYTEEDCTWEPKENLKNVKYLIDEYEAKHGEKEKSKSEKSIFLKNKTKRNNPNSNNSFKDDEKSNSVTSGENKGNNGMTNSQKNLIGKNFFYFINLN